jgi:hypothetical protein
VAIIPYVQAITLFALSQVVLLTYNAALKVIGYVRASLDVSSWGRFEGSATILQLPARHFSSDTDDIAAMTYDLALFASSLIFSYQTWKIVSGHFSAWLHHKFVALSLIRKRVQPRQNS